MHTIKKENPVKKIINFIISPLDMWIMIPIFLIIIFSSIVLYSANQENLELVIKKLVFTLIALVILWTLAKTPSHYLARFAFPFYILCLILLIAVDIYGATKKGATRWLDLGFIQLQPSELMKISLPMTVAWFFQSHEYHIKPIHFIPAIFLVLIPGILIILQPDLGSALLIMASGFFVIYFAGLSWKIIITGILSLPVILPVFWYYILFNYQKERIMTFLNPTTDLLGEGYHINQSLIAIGSGGLLGKGWLNGSQTHLSYLPERTTDFIFAVHAEEFGFIGILILLTLYTIILWRCFNIANSSKTLYGRLLCGALTLTFFFYLFINMGMVSGILPVVGIPLPLFSYGGTATLSIMIIFGLIMSIRNDSK